MESNPAQDLQEIIAEDEQEKKSRVPNGRHVFDDFFSFRSKMGQLVKAMQQEPDKRLVLAVQRNFSNSALKQLEYIIEVTTADKLHIFDISNMAGDMAIPAAPNYPNVEEEKDPTKE